MKYLVVLLALSLSFVACKKEEEEGVSAEEQALIDDQIIQDYMTENQITDAVKHASGVYYRTREEGTGASPTVYSTVKIYYTGMFLDGEVFDDYEGKLAVFSLQNLIKGWQIGIPLMKKKEKATFFIPSGLAYGVKGRGSIPGNSVLIFDVYLYDFQ